MQSSKVIMFLAYELVSLFNNEFSVYESYLTTNSNVVVAISIIENYQKGNLCCCCYCCCRIFWAIHAVCCLFLIFSFFFSFVTCCWCSFCPGDYKTNAPATHSKPLCSRMWGSKTGRFYVNATIEWRYRLWWSLMSKSLLMMLVKGSLQHVFL